MIKLNIQVLSFISLLYLAVLKIINKDNDNHDYFAQNVKIVQKNFALFIQEVK